MTLREWLRRERWRTMTGDDTFEQVDEHYRVTVCGLNPDGSHQFLSDFGFESVRNLGRTLHKVYSAVGVDNLTEALPDFALDLEVSDISYHGDAICLKTTGDLSKHAEEFYQILRADADAKTREEQERTTKVIQWDILGEVYGK